MTSFFPSPPSSDLLLPKAFADSIPNGLIVTDLDLRLTQVNRWITRSLGLDLNNLIGKSIGEAFPELAQRNLLEAYRLVIQTSMPLTLANRIHRYFIKMPPAASYTTTFSEMPQSVIISPLFENKKIIGTLTTIIDVTERVMTERAIQNEVQKLNALHAIDRALSTLDIDKCLHTIVQNSLELFRAEMVCLFLYEGDELKIACQLPDEQPINNNQVLFKTVAENLKPASVSKNSPKQVDGKPAEMAAPLIAENTCIGILNVRTSTRFEYNNDDLRLLETLASRAAVAIHNARLHQKEKMQREQMESLKDISITLTSELNPDTVLDSLLVAIERVIPYDSARVIFAGDGELIVARHRGYEGCKYQDYWDNSRFALDDFPYLNEMAAKKMPIILADTQKESGWTALEALSHVRSCAGAPIFVRGVLTGFLLLEKNQVGYYSQDYVNILAAFSAQAGIALENARSFEQQQRLARIDGLTGLTNRRAFDEILSCELERCLRLNEHTSLVMIDIDFFKHFNDTYGHLVGDNVLKNLAVLLRRSLRPNDTLARFGGEEFVIILPETDIDRAKVIAESLCEKVARMHQDRPLADAELPEQQITISLGLSTAPQFAQTPIDLIKTADLALYQAKHGGRNQYHVFNHLETAEK